MRSIFWLILALGQASSIAKGGQERPPFAPGEKSSYSITYFGATAGILDLEVLPPVKQAGVELQELQAKARTDSIFSFFYRLKNIYSSTLDRDSGLPIRWMASLEESRQEGTTVQEFDRVKGVMRFSDHRLDKKKGKIEKEMVKPIPAGVQDVISAVFYLRSLPLEKGRIFEIPVVIGEEPTQLRAEVVEMEDLSTKIGKLPAFVLKPSLFKNGQVREIPETLIWISQNKDRALLKVKAKVKIGSVVAYLRSYEPGQEQAKGLAAVKRGRKARASL